MFQMNKNGKNLLSEDLKFFPWSFLQTAIMLFHYSSSLELFSVPKFSECGHVREVIRIFLTKITKFKNNKPKNGQF
jgi:hypothetical protein